MTINIEQANALMREYAYLIKDQQGQIIEMRKQIEQLKFELSSQLNKEYDV
jgi:hypothetical protein